MKYTGGTSSAVRRYVNVKKDAAKKLVASLNKEVKNKNVLITGKKKIKITKVMNLLSKMLKIESKPKI